MPISFPKAAEEQNADNWRLSHWEQRRAKYKAELKALDVELQKLVDAKRKAFENYLFEVDLKTLETFTKNRKPSQSAEQFYTEQAADGLKELLAKEKTNYRSLGEMDRKQISLFRQNVASAAAFIKQFTDHPRYVEDGKKFKVKIDEAKLRTHAEEEVARIVDAFVQKVQQKLLDLIVANGSYVASLKNYTFSRGVIEADMAVQFKKGKGMFLAKLYAKTNFSSLGRPFMQYPLTFHNVTSPDGKLEAAALVSEADMLKHFNAEAWEPPPMPKERHFGTLKLGDIVLMDDDTHALVVRQRKDEVTVWHPKTGDRAKCRAENMKKVVGRTSGTYQRMYHGKDPGPHRCLIEGVLQNWKLDVPRSMVSDAEMSFAAETEAVRKAGFQLWLKEQGK